MTNFEVMQTDLNAYIEEHQLFSRKDRLLIGVSGGVDSMTLLHLLEQLEYQISVAHMNFSLRGTEADEDERLVIEVGNLLHVPVFTKKVATQDYAEKRGISIQMAARDLRYMWFDELREENHFDHIVTAHNANDNLETVLFNLTKGTGIRGLRGIKAKEGHLVRPLLFASKSAIVAFAEANDIQWREDASNQETKYARNKLRQEVIPVLQEINPSLIDHFENTRRRIRGTEQILMHRVNEIRNQYTHWSEGSFFIRNDWMSEQASDAVILSELLREFGFSFAQSLDVSRAANQPGKLFQTEKFVLNIDRGQFILKLLDQQASQSTIEIHRIDGIYEFGNWSLKLTEQPVSDFTKGTAVNEVFLDVAKVQFPLTLRIWKQGDTFQPLGMRGKKKISDFLVDRKVPLIEKTAVMVLESADHICWVVNYRLDDRCKVTDKTSKILKITCQKSFEDGPITV